MNLVACPRCSAQMDVSSFQPGTKFQCGGCGNILEVPAAPPVVKPVAQPVAKPVAKPVARPAASPAAPPAAPPPAMLQKRPAVDPRRAGGSAPAAPAAGRAERIRRQRGEGGEGAKRKNPLPLVLAGIGVLALAGGGLAFLVKGKGGEEKEETVKAPTPALGPGSGAKAAPPKETTFEELPKAEQIARVDQRVKDATKSAASTRDSYEWLLTKGFGEDAQKALRAGFAAFPTDPWIAGTLGLRDRTADIRAVTNDDETMVEVPEETPELRFVLVLDERVKKDKTGGWLREEESKEFDRSVEVLKGILAQGKDPVFARSKMEYSNVRSGGLFSGMDFSFESYRPYVIFVEQSSPDRRAAADEIVKHTGKALQFVYNRWLAFMKDDLKLAPPRLEDLKDDRLKVFVFKSRESFDAWHVRNKQNNPGPTVAAYYEHGRNRMILMHMDAFDPGVIMHEATHQIIHYYARWFCQRDDDLEAKKKDEPLETVQWEDSRLRSTFFWFQEGIAEYFGGVRPVKGKEWEEWTIGELQPDRIAFFKYMQKQGKLWPVEDFLYEDQGGVVARSKVRGALEWEELRGLLYAQGWTLVHYFLEGADGKYRERFLAMMRNEITGKSGQLFLLEAFGLPKRPSDPKVKEFLKEIEAGYVPYHEGLFLRLVREMANK